MLLDYEAVALRLALFAARLWRDLEIPFGLIGFERHDQLAFLLPLSAVLRAAGFFVGVELFFVRFMGERIGTGRSS